MSSTPTATFPANIFPKILLGVANFAEYLHVEATGETNNPPPCYFAEWYYRLYCDEHFRSF